MHIVSVPISVQVTKKKKFYLNINNYRNANHFILARAKVLFHELVAPLVKHIPAHGRVDLIYTLFVGSNQLIDTNNVCSVVDKFFSDVLVNVGILEDDNCHIVKDTKFTYGGIDKSNPRVEVTIAPHAHEGNSTNPTTQRTNNMQIILVQTEIEEAIRDYVNARLTVNDGQRIDIDLKATRGDAGYQAFVDIVANDAPVKVAAPAEAPVEETPAPKAAAKAKPATVAVQKTRRTTKPVEVEPATTEAPVEQTEAKVEPVSPGWRLRSNRPKPPLNNPQSKLTPSRRSSRP